MNPDKMHGLLRGETNYSELMNESWHRNSKNQRNCQQQWDMSVLKEQFTVLWVILFNKVIKMFFAVLHFRLNHHFLFLFYSQETTMKLWEEVNLLCRAQHAKTIVLTIMLIAAKFHLRRWLNFLKIVALT